MATKRYQPPRTQPRRIDPGEDRYWRGGADHRVMNALLYLDLAREAAARNDFERACRGYRRALDSWHALNTATGNTWREEQERTNREYASFLLGN